MAQGLLDSRRRYLLALQSGEVEEKQRASVSQLLKIIEYWMFTLVYCIRAGVDELLGSISGNTRADTFEASSLVGAQLGEMSVCWL